MALILGRAVSGESALVTAQRLLFKFSNLKTVAAASLEELSKIRGIGLAKAAQIKAASELAKRIENNMDALQKPVIKTLENVVELVKSGLRDQKEHSL
ncbi:UPF0758 domain-containing protein [Chloroflexota bacterium]